MDIGAKTNNVRMYSWGATQNGLLPPDAVVNNNVVNGNTAAESKISNVVRGKSQAPKSAAPNSIYQQEDNEKPDIIKSTTIYNEQGRPDTREDFPGTTPHFIKETQNYSYHPIHQFLYNDKGQRISEVTIPLDTD